MMRITSRNKRVTFSTNLFVEPIGWDQDKQRVKGTSPLIREINNVLLNLTTSAWNTYNDHIKKDFPIEPVAIRDILLRKNKLATSLIEAFTYQIDNLKARVGHDTAINTAKKYQTTDRKIKAFLTEMTGVSPELADFIKDRQIHYSLGYDYGMGGLEICNETEGQIKWTRALKK